MKLFTFAFVVVASMVIAVSADEKYTTKYDNVDVDEILKSDRLFKNYYNCLIDKGKCTPDARELKKTLPDALKTECSKCSEKQKQNSEKVLHYIIDEKPEEWKVLQTKYDPEKIYYNKYKGEAQKRGYNV
ncbi:ejaculatory bulb-specific protein 3-like isoform X2 [Haematobia irritans]|uniref:Putative insect pheromone-binding family n=1 Tax=Haematobia irritans TaxID=7368 RepID=A0A1L8EHT3_HAEIR